tara:strand:+ start:2601 stop:3284 length:684 start_codon:yes stop_codon:yes gene_type:complete
MIGFIYIFSSFFIPLINFNFNRRTAIQNVITSSLYNPKYGGDNINYNDNDNDNDNDKNAFIRCVNNDIYYSGSITDETIFGLTSTIINLQNENQSNEINLHIQSNGGALLPTLSLVDLIRISDTPINTFVMGYAASSASLISVVGRQRFINKHGVMLIHQLKMGVEFSKYNELRDQYVNAYTLMNIIKQIYLENTKLSERQLDSLLSHDYWLNSTLCKQHGLIDIIQ